MSNSDDRPIEGLQQWQAGIVVLLAVAVVASLGALGLEAAGVPYGQPIGPVLGGVLASLAISYRFYGR